VDSSIGLQVPPEEIPDESGDFCAVCLEGKVARIEQVHLMQNIRRAVQNIRRRTLRRVRVRDGMIAVTC